MSFSLQAHMFWFSSSLLMSELLHHNTLNMSSYQLLLSRDLLHHWQRMLIGRLYLSMICNHNTAARAGSGERARAASVMAQFHLLRPSRTEPYRAWPRPTVWWKCAKGTLVMVLWANQVVCRLCEQGGWQHTVWWTAGRLTAHGLVDGGSEATNK